VDLLKNSITKIARSITHRIPGGFLWQAGIYGLGQAVEGLSSVLLLPVFLVYLNPDDFAVVALADMAAMMMAAFWGVRLSGSVTRFYYEYVDEEKDRFVASIWWAAVANAILGLALVHTLGPWVLPYFVTQVAYSPYLEIMVWTVFFRCFAEVPLAVMRIREEAHLVVGVTLATFFISVGAKFYYVVIAAEGGLGVLKALLLAAACSASGYMIYMMRRYPKQLNLEYVKRAIQYSWPLTPDGLLSGFTLVLDRFFLDKWVPLTLIGYYAVASQFGAIAYQTVVTLKMAFVPAVTRNWIERGAERWNIGQMAFLMIAIVAIVALTVSLFAQDLLMAFGRERFVAAIQFVPFLSINGVLVALVTVTSMSLLLSKRTKWFPVASIVHLSASGICNLTLTPAFGLWGAITGTLVGWGSRAVCFFSVGRRVLPLPVRWGHVSTLLLPLVPLMLLGTVRQSNTIAVLIVKLCIVLLYSCYAMVLFRSLSDTRSRWLLSNLKRARVGFML
jgi:O-antigen/teichoic acid export membrane protein